jgi:23S rRNA (uracil1939-C5)-methyltransferase
MAKRDRGKWNVPPAGEIFPLHLESLSHQGSTIARKEGQVVFAAFGIPGEDADVLIERVHKDYLEGRVTNVHTPSPHRVTPRCEYFGECGGCQLQHIDYDYQLELKRSVVVEQLRRIGKLDDIDVRPTLASPDPWHYRNHARFTVDREGYLGFTMRGRKRIVRTMTCYIIHPWIRDTMQQLQGACRGMRQVAMRVGFHTGDTLIQPPLPPAPSPAAAGEGELDARAVVGEGSVRSESATVSTGGAPDLNSGRDADTISDTSTSIGAQIEKSADSPQIDLPLSRRSGGGGGGAGVVSGQKTFDEALLGERFRVSAASFFQVNTEQAENLVRLVQDGLGLTTEDVLLDAYAGVGTFAKTLASRVKKVIAIEVSASSVNDGKYNTLGIENVDWLLGEVEALLPDLRERPTAVVLDPSRQGCGMPALDALIDARVPRIAYVSCEPATLARDLRILVDGGYSIDFVQPVDMFPQTYHIESVAILRAERGGMRDEG